ncbi:MAG TPA: hypothetical protein EYN38_01880 [Flavobacteriales bacterium]|nr:hypothetical protein [Flavobacteriales bacterium]HIA12254.1 hypothetical protein [Flavobacteriales bacterium]HIO71835.1 hypothetical protein [Flavobacteriales bacterium]
MKLKIIAVTLLAALSSTIWINSSIAERYPLAKEDKTTGDNSNTGSAQKKSSGTNSLLAGCAEPNGATYIEFNNVRALIHTGGDMFWDLDNDVKYEVPKNSLKHSMFLSSLWLGGTDVNQQLRIAAQRYRGGGVDFWTGPLDTSGTAEITPDVCAEWDKHFIITRQEVDEFVAWFNEPDAFPAYVIPNSILDWPAHGDVSKGQSYYMAPFYDQDGDGFYDPYNGDYPYYDLKNEECNRSRDRVSKLFGDITFWFVFNDKGNLHKETEGDAIGLEVQAQEFAFATNDEINNMTFTNYRIINRSTFTLINTYFGTNFDPDLGDAQDDYVGCDVKRGLGYCYNGKAVDGTGATWHYGLNPPAIGVDFFEGPFQDPDGADNPADSACNAFINGSINGLNFGDGEVDNERWGMRRLVYYCNQGQGCNFGVQGDPSIAVHYYAYLRGYWKDGTRMVYGGNGHVGNCTSCEYADFMFPGAKSNPTQTDECNWGVCQNEDGTNCGITPGDPLPWTEQQANNDFGDRRFVHSAGPFTLAPGAENDITVGIVWARATSSDPFESVELVRLADDKAQALFDNCFKVLNGPDAPALTYQELNQEIILYISNPATSNNVNESYHERDPLIIVPQDYPGIDDGVIIDIEYRFQGYQIFQLKDSSVAVSDVRNTDLARLVAQVDIKDGIAKLINIEYDEAIGAEVPSLMVNGNDVGISHSFKVTDDLFATGTKALVNHKKYYFLALAYSHNQYYLYNGYADSLHIASNKKPYLAGRKTGLGGSIESITCIPHKSEPELAGTVINSVYGDSPEITRIEGQGNGGLNLDLSSSTLDNIMAGPPWSVEKLGYIKNAGPLGVKVIDPLQVKGGQYIVKFFLDPRDTIEIAGMVLNQPPVNTAGLTKFEIDKAYRDKFSVGQVVYIEGSLENDGEWTIFGIAESPQNGNNLALATEEYLPSNDKVQMGLVYPGYRWALMNANNPTDTLFISEQTINTRNEELITNLGISITIEQVRHPGAAASIPSKLTGISSAIGNANPDPANGFLTASMTFADPNYQWLIGITDGDAPNGLNWIRSGTSEFDYIGIDDAGSFENLLGGIWAPGRLASKDSLGPMFEYNNNNDRPDMANLASVNIVLTSDKSKWTRAVVIEQQENPLYTQPLGSSIPKLNLRGGLSVDKNGVPFDTTGLGIGDSDDTFDSLFMKAGQMSSSNENSANYISGTGMGWFPGYAINIETGERLNIMFGEDSWLANGNDMIWNPTADITDPIFANTTGCVGCAPDVCEPFLNPCLPFRAGGKHFIYIMGHNGDDTTDVSLGRGDIPAYDAGEYIRQIMDGSPVNNVKLGVFNDVMWVGFPLLQPGYDFSNPSQMPTDVTIKLRVQKPYKRNFSTDSSMASTPLNDNNPMYIFDLDAFETRTNVNEIAVEALESINIVPNPYFAFSTYETGQIDHRVKIINLPVECTVSIYNLNGTLIRQYERDETSLTSIDWDLKNFKSVPIASGVYLIHINAPGIGERVLKWFGVLRPIDLDSF